MENDFKIIQIEGWHGADERDFESIKKNNFLESPGELHWLGEGVYFFTHGVGDTLLHARNWIQSEAFKRKTRRYVVLFAQINVNDESILDLREASGRDTFDKHRSFIISKMAKNRTYFNEDYRKVDGKVIEHLKRISGYEVVINDFFVQFGLSRKYQIVSRVPNCTFLCVSNPTENISKDSIKIVEMGNI